MKQCADLFHEQPVGARRVGNLAALAVRAMRLDGGELGLRRDELGFRLLGTRAQGGARRAGGGCAARPSARRPGVAADVDGPHACRFRGVGSPRPRHEPPSVGPARNPRARARLVVASPQYYYYYLTLVMRVLRASSSASIAAPRSRKTCVRRRGRHVACFRRVIVTCGCRPCRRRRPPSAGGGSDRSRYRGPRQGRRREPIPRTAVVSFGSGRFVVHDRGSSASIPAAESFQAPRAPADSSSPALMHR